MTPFDLRALRTRLGMTQGAAARLVGVDSRAWRYWEYGERPVPASVALLMNLLAEVPEAMAWVMDRAA